MHNASIINMDAHSPARHNWVSCAFVHSYGCNYIFWWAIFSVIHLSRPQFHSISSKSPHSLSFQHSNIQYITLQHTTLHTHSHVHCTVAHYVCVCIAYVYITRIAVYLNVVLCIIYLTVFESCECFQ